MEQGIIGLAGVMLGSIGTYLIQRQTWRVQQLQVLRLELASINLLIWDEENGYIKLNAHFQHLRVRLDMLGFDPEMLETLKRSALDCWNAHHTSIEEGDGLGGISTKLLDKLEHQQTLLDKKLKG